MAVDICNLKKWMTNNGYKDLDNMKPYNFKDSGRGLMATRSLSEGDTIIEVPSSLIITSHTVMGSLIGDIIQCHHITPLQALCLFLVYERQRSEASFWAEYISSLPDTYPVPASWSPELISRLPTVLADDVSKQRHTVRVLYDECHSVIDEIERAHPAFRGGFTYERFVWAWSTVNTRCVYWRQTSHPSLRADGEDHYALVPYLDLLNHSASAQTDAGYDPRSKCYRVRTLTPYNTGDQVFISYGPHSNKKLLLEYGFILPDNHVDYIPGDIDDVCSVTASLGICDDTWLEIVTKNDMHLGLGFSDEGLTWSLLTVLKIASLPIMDIYKWTECLEEGYLSDEHRQQTGKLVKALVDTEQRFAK